MQSALCDQAFSVVKLYGLYPCFSFNTPCCCSYLKRLTYLDLEDVSDFLQQKRNMDITAYLSTPLQLDKICRTCLSIKGDMRPLFGACLDEMLSSFASIEVKINTSINFTTGKNYSRS